MAAKKNGKTLNLSAIIDLNEASSMRDKFLSLRGSDLSIDASAVERVGTLGAQVLMAAAKTWDQDNLAFTFSKASDAFQKTMQLIGVDIHHLLAKEIRQ
ncbi:STAS domain-containing protein [Rhizobium grahamii]|uniref:STAS domain-containing protein n=1 Tax=Rhizobium grahamii TaxID=1120045 RepID=A0A5Q0BZJ4_9HYPH|nr:MULTISPECIES: STAS domain-containing protein [Rhizobium]QFY59048.1 STAS domain-containing protein [Rhizobium grahamii]QRM48433.1 STAS domain-containing protein [Rhizobium sp. BG6]